MRKLIFKISISVVAVLIMVGGYLYFTNLNKIDASKGIVTIEVFDINNEMIINDKLEFREEDTLVSLLENNYKVILEDGPYGKTLLAIDKIETDFKTTYLAIYVDGKYATTGISGINLVDGRKITFCETKI